MFKQYTRTGVVPRKNGMKIQRLKKKIENTETNTSALVIVNSICTKNATHFIYLMVV